MQERGLDPTLRDDSERFDVNLLEARGEFVALIDCDAGFQEAMKDALEFDKRVKMVFAGPQLCSGSSRGLGQTVATYGFTGQLETYVRKGRQEGDRIGIAFDRPPEGWAVEY